MLNTIIQKELRSILLSPKFTATFIVCTILILLSIFTGIKEYQAARENYDIATTLSEDELKQETSWAKLETKLFREPDPLQILVSGLGYDIGRYSLISPERSVKLEHSAYSDDPIFAMFRFIDFAFIVQFVLTLLAILFTYDAVSGEREQGTLKLVLANAVPRTKYLVGKSIGAWIGLVVPVTIPILLSLGMILAFGITLSGSQWLSIFALLGLSLLLFTFFIILGVLVSTLTSRSSTSFLLSLVLWVLFVLIIPRSAIMAAGQFVDVPRVAEIDGQRDAFAADRWNQFYSSMDGVWGNMNTEDTTNEEITEADQEELDSRMWEMMQRQDSLRREVEQEIETYEVRLMDDLRVRKEAQQRLAFTLSRFSPVSAYQLAAMNLTQTDVGDKERWEEAMKQYRTQFNDYTQKMQKENKDIGGVMIALTFESEDGPDGEEGEGKSNLTIGGNRDKDVIDLSDLPRFAPLDRSAVQTAGLVSIDFGIIILSILIAFAIAYVRFIRYDIR